MKALKIILLLLFILILILVGGAVYIVKTFEINKYKPQIVQQLSDALGQKVKIKNLSYGFSIKDGLALKVEGFSIGSSAPEMAAPMIDIRSLELGVDVAAFLSTREVVVTQVLVQSPRINVYRQADGHVNISDLGSPSMNAPAGSSSGVNTESDQSAPKSAEFKDLKLFIRSVDVVNVSLSYVDATFDKGPLKIQVEDMDLHVDSFSLTKPFNFTMAANVLSSRQNIFVTGSAQVYQDSQKIWVRDAVLKTNLSGLSKEKLNEVLKIVAGISVENSVQGQVALDLNQFIFAVGQDYSFDAEGKLTDGAIKLADLPYAVDNIDIHFSANENKVTVEEVFFYLASGKISAKGVVENYLTTQDFKFKGGVEELKLAELTEPYGLPVQLLGNIFGNFAVAGKSFNPEVLLPGLLGDASFEVSDGRIKDINLLKLVLSKVSMIPDLANTIEANLSEAEKEKLKRSDTVLEEAKTAMTIAGSAVSTKTTLNADGFIVTADGRVGFDQQASIRSALAIHKALSSSMVKEAQQLSGLVNEEGRIFIPLKTYNGPIAKFVAAPDLEYIGKKIISTTGKEELKKVIYKPLDRGQEAQPGGATAPVEGGTTKTEGGQPQQQKPQRPEDVLIENVLDMIFK